MAVNFPDAPSNGDSFSVNDTTYVYNATAGYWDITSTVQASASTGTNAPSNPSAGDFWFDPSSLTTYIYYSDGTSSQWIPANSVGARGAPGPGYPTSYYSVDYTSTTTGNVVFNSSSTPTLPSYTVGKVNAWVNGVLRSDIYATDGSNVEISLSTGDEVQIINFGDTDVLDPTASSNDHTTYTTLSSLIDTVQSNVTSAGSGVAVYATPDLLPLSGNDAGEQAYVNSTNRLYINNGTGWYSIGLVNSSPSITSVLDGDSNTTPFTLSTDGSSSIITITASDPEDIPLTYNYSVTSGTLTNGGGTTATIVQGTGSNTNQFTVTPSTTEAYAGTFDLTFTASDGINTATNVNSFDLSWASTAYYGDRAVVFLGTVNTIDYFSISTAGSTSDFGNQSASMFYRGACSNGERALAAGGLITGGSVGQSTIDYYTIASPSNSTDFGDLTNARRSLGAASDGLRGVFGGGTSGDANSGVTIDYVTIATTGNAIDFGDLTETRNGVGAAASDGTYALFAGKGTVIDRITIQTTGNASDFGDLLASKERFGGLSDNSRAVWGGGHTITNQMQYNTIATAGNSVDFGDLVNTVYGLSGTSDGTYGVFSGGAGSGNIKTNVIQRIVVQTTGNASDFGDLSSANRYSSSTSGAA